VENEGGLVVRGLVSRSNVSLEVRCREGKPPLKLSSSRLWNQWGVSCP